MDQARPNIEGAYFVRALLNTSRETDGMLQVSLLLYVRTVCSLEAT